MAEAVCGPSNPLQSLQKHATGLLPHQQDRLRAHASSGQGFRSADPRAGALDADFAAFESGQPFHPHAQAPFNAPSHYGPSVLSPDASSSWANDFQNLRLNGPNQPIPQSQFRHEAPLHRSQPAANGWHAEFMRQQQSRQSPTLYASQQNYTSSPYMMNGNMPLAFDGYGASQFAPSQSVQDFAQTSQQKAPTADDAAFEDAFAQAESEQVSRSAHVDAEIAEEPQSKPETMDDVSDAIRIGSDLIPERSSPTNLQQEKAEADDLARTAGDLLNALKHDQSEKFQQSTFLSLMRRIRDREVEVKGDDLEETKPMPSQNWREEGDTYQPLHPGGPFYPEQSGMDLSSYNLADEFDKVPESAPLARRYGLGAKPSPATGVPGTYEGFINDDVGSRQM